MSILTVASGASVWRGYTYYKDNKVLLFSQIGEDEYEGMVAGNAADPYHVKINVAHIRQSKCNCPHANGRRIICKHMVALFFTAFPKEAEQYIAEVEAYEREKEERERAHYKEIEQYVYSLSKAELRESLIRYMLESEQLSYW